MKILHVTECFAGGVATAINMYASLVPEHEHMVLYTARRANSPAKAYPELFSQSWRLPDHHRAAIDTVRRVRDEVAPDVIHAHSSFAGAYVRLARLRGTRRRTPTVYTPHGVAFARNDISALHRAVFYPPNGHCHGEPPFSHHAASGKATFSDGSTVEYPK